MGCLGRSPENLRSDNGPEFVARMVQKWLEKSGIRACYIEPGAPWENGHVESFHAQLRAELLDRELYLEMEEVNVGLLRFFGQRGLGGGRLVVEGLKSDR